MVYFGGFTFDRENPTTHLKIPNAVAAQRIAEVILERYKLSQSLPVALQALLQDGDIEGVLSCYRDVMTDRDVTKKELTATTEENIGIPSITVFYETQTSSTSGIPSDKGNP